MIKVHNMNIWKYNEIPLYNLYMLIKMYHFYPGHETETPGKQVSPCKQDPLLLLLQG
jgi:hypothetical protein